jgi:enoyl-CoA hydratase/carnithine racemase
LGVIPGAGGTQRLVKAVGKSKAMEMILTGNVNLNATEALNLGLVSKVVPIDDLVDEAVKTAETIANMSQPSVQMAKEAVNKCKLFNCERKKWGIQLFFAFSFRSPS